MMLRKTLFLLMCFCLTCVSSIYAQEALSPMEFNPALPHRMPEKATSHALQKSASHASFPISDWFSNPPYPDSSIWTNQDVLINNNEAIFDAFDINHTVYGNSDHTADQLISLPIDLSNYYSNSFIRFGYRTGEDFGPGDSLVLQGLDYNGNWQYIWRSPYIKISGNQQLFGFIPAPIFRHKQFQLRFIAYCDHLKDTVNDLFRISGFVFSQMLQPGFYELFKTTDFADSSASAWNWMQEQNRCSDGTDIGFAWGKVAEFDNQNSKHIPYFSADGLHHGLDTLCSNPFDLQGLNDYDSLRLSFLISGNALLQIGDTLYLEFKNRLGIWNRVWYSAGKPFSSFYKTVLPVNNPNYRHRFFQFRFINTGSTAASDTAKWYVSAIALQSAAQLPLTDDFSSTSVYPRSNTWEDKNVYINNHFSYTQPSLQVATFDGLDKNGNAYSIYATKGMCDVLTSVPFDISKYKPSDSLMLSFQFQYLKQGADESVFPSDSLIIRARSTEFSNDSFENIWSISASDTLNRYETFTKVILPITDSRFFHGQFQLQFANYGSQTGNLSQWNVDYIRFAPGRHLSDSMYEDVALTRATPTFLKKYTSMPYAHFKQNPSGYKQDSIQLTIHNNGFIPYPVDYKHTTYDPKGKVLGETGSVIGTLLPDADSVITFADPISLQSFTDADSLIVTNCFSARYSNNKFDKIPQNDSFVTQTIFSNYFAYDDGSAESGYGVRNKTNCGGALAFDLEFPDSLYGFYIFYNQAEQSISNRIFNLNIWSDLTGINGFTGPNDVLLYKIFNTKVHYMNSINGFTYYALDSAIAVPNRFYIGWNQYQSFMMNIGFDKNYRNHGDKTPNPNQYYFSDGVWNPSEIPGTMMIRPIVGKRLNVPTGMHEISKKENTEKPICFPNPTQESFSIQFASDKIHVQVKDMHGRTIIETDSTENISLEHCESGMYIIQMTTLKSGNHYFEKIIKQ